MFGRIDKGASMIRKVHSMLSIIRLPYCSVAKARRRITQTIRRGLISLLGGYPSVDEDGGTERWRSSLGISSRSISTGAIYSPGIVAIQYVCGAVGER